MQDIFHTVVDYSKQSYVQKISISLRPDGFSFVIQSVDTDDLLAVFHTKIEESLEIQKYVGALQSFFKHDLLQQTFQKITIIYVTPKITIIPSSLFSEHTVALLYEANHVRLPSEAILQYKLKHTEGYLLYAVPQTIIDECYASFGTHIQILPQAAPFLESSCIQNKLMVQKNVFVSLEQTFFDIAVVEGQKIILYNTFEYSNNNDYMYYVLHVFEQLRLHPMEQQLLLSGIISKASHYFESACMFIKNVSIVEPPQSHKGFMQYPFNQSLYPLFCNVCNVSLCE
ncbi:MAG TPA: DUF3822 family protein [Bacteroidales bacterium]|nr:MAG: hypothetical protein BWY22_00225 [Bacteroidetes bacterium ADurb.Bin217]HPH16689.1 DUF3822 family protein [Bacteroidales bacterium]HPM12160.1 DUF3822 family protein [Bacteroidales bacterium]